MHRRIFGLLLAALLLLPISAMAQDMTDADVMAQINEIYNFVEISDDLSTSGQISYDDIPLLNEAGFEVIVNLAPASEERNGLEGFLVVQEGMTYVHIPVSWQDPSPRDLQLFFDVMEANKDRKVFVHCFANMRVSAFVYLYRLLAQNEDQATAQADLAKVWDPFELDQWAAFINTALED